MILAICPNPAIDVLFQIEKLNLGETNRLQTEHYFPGGKGINVALACKEMGENCALSAIWGGMTGDWLKKTCEEKGLVCHGLKIAEWNRLSVNLFSTEHETEFLGQGPHLSKQFVDEFIDLNLQLSKKADIVTISGSWPQNTSGMETAKFVSKLHNTVKIFVDCSGEQLQNTLQAKPYGIHINQKESFELFGENDVLKNLKRMSQIFALSAISCGEKGAYFAIENHFYKSSCVVADVFSTLGCGDCMLAGMAVAELKKESAENLIRRATAAASANCLSKELGMIQNSLVETLIPTVEIVEINL